MEAFDRKLRRVLAEQVEVVDYDPAWPATFRAESARLATFFPTGCIRRIEHIGSTAVPGLAAKPVIDILVGVDDLDFVDRVVAPLMEAAGYDYFLRPAFGDQGPRYPWFVGRNQSGGRISHIHVVSIDDASHWDRVLFRDYLRAHPDTAREYEALKRGLAAEHSDDRESYTLAKGAFIGKVTAAAKRESIS
jgi:GrpB-like predicted nucleotidyltransferase (UPF0157 family)